MKWNEISNETIVDNVENIFNDRQNNGWISSAPRLLVRHGSCCYGLATDSSDIDVKGCVVTPVKSLIQIKKPFEQIEFKSKSINDVKLEGVVYDSRKFVDLAADCNPNIIECIFVSSNDILQVDPTFIPLLENRNAFLTKKAYHTFMGYAKQQMKRMITHRSWMINPPSKHPEPEDFDLDMAKVPKHKIEIAMSIIEGELAKTSFKAFEQLDSALKIQLKGMMADILSMLKITDEDAFVSVAKSLSFSDDMVDYLTRYKKYTVALADYKKYKAWLETRNEARFALEKRNGYDSKNAMHLFRLTRMCAELFETGSLNVRRTYDREELLYVRGGNLTYDEILSKFEVEENRMKKSIEGTKLPAAVDDDVVSMVMNKIYEIE